MKHKIPKLYKKIAKFDYALIYKEKNATSQNTNNKRQKYKGSTYDKDNFSYIERTLITWSGED